MLHSLCTNKTSNMQYAIACVFLYPRYGVSVIENAYIFKLSMRIEKIENQYLEELIASDLNKTVQTSTQVWPSGLRRHVQVVVSPEAWVRIPPLAHFSIPTWTFIFDLLAIFLLADLYWPETTFPNVKMQRVNSEFLYLRWILVVNEPLKLI